MKVFKDSKFKSIVLSLTLTLSILFTGCSNIDNYTDVDSTSSNHKPSINLENPQDNNEININSIDNTNLNNNVPTDSTKATVTRVVDGDTIKVNLEDTDETVTLRLLLVDTPESVKPGVAPQPYSLEASAFAKKSLTSTDTVFIEYDKGNKTDKYNRHLGYLWFYCREHSDWEIFNEEIISKGYARVGYVYSQRRYLDRFYNAQDEAKAFKLNIWSVPGYVTDKGYNVDAYNNNKNTSPNNSDATDNEESVSKIVYVNGGSSSSNIYHSSATAHNMKDSIKMSEEEAKSSSYAACSLCY